jgi:hypothetical protein
LWLRGPDNRGAIGAENSTAEGTLGTSTNFLIEFVQILGVHLIVAGGSGPLDPPASYAASPLLHRRAHNHRTTGVEANMTTDKRHYVRRRGYQALQVNRRGDRLTTGDLSVESQTPDVLRSRHRNNRRHGDLQRDSNKMMRRQQRETSDHDMLQQHNNGEHISIQLISICLVTVILW